MTAMITTTMTAAITTHTQGEMPLELVVPADDPVTGRRLMNDKGPYVARMSPLLAGCDRKPVHFGLQASSSASFQITTYGSSRYRIACIWWTMPARCVASVTDCCCACSWSYCGLQ